MIEEMNQNYSFSYTDCNGKVYTKTINTPGATWYECMDDYVKFLESVFGYDIKKQVRLEEPIWLGTMGSHHRDWSDPWTGAYFTKEAVEDEVNHEDLWSEEE